MALFFYQFTPLYGHNPRAPFLVAAVEHFPNFLNFCSTFEAARPDFEKSGIQKSDFPLCLCPFLDVLTHGNENRLFLLISSITGNRACIRKNPD